MIEFRSAPAPHVVVLRVSGTLNLSDTKQGIVALDRALALHDRVALAVELDAMKGASLDAILRDLRYWLDQAGRLDRFSRGAVITDKKWIETVASWEDRLLPGVEIRTFPTSRRDEALAWAAEPPAPPRPTVEPIRAEPATSDDGTPILAYALSGPISAADLKQMETAFAAHERFHLLVRVYDFALPRFGAVSSSLARVKAEALRRIDRYAVVGGPEWTAGLLKVVAPLLPQAARHFARGDEAEAWTWLGGAAEGAAPAPASPDEPSIEVVPTERPDLLAFAIAGHLTADDYERTLTPRLEEALRATDAVDLLLRFDDFDGMSFGAMKEEAGLVSFVDQLRRIAVIGGPDWMAAAAKALAPLLPLNARFFAADDEAAAWAWLDAEPATAAPAAAHAP
jgi:hypothetical protein